jgi:hypothetical protein
MLGRGTVHGAKSAIGIDVGATLLPPSIRCIVMSLAPIVLQIARRTNDQASLFHSATDRRSNSG